MSTILLVEDAPDLAQLINRELENIGYRVILAADGLSGLELFQRSQPDLVVLDWMLPGLDGLEVLRRIRQTSAVPVLMLTARGEETDRVVGLELGADDYLTKPFSLRELVARIRALFRRSELLKEMLAADRSAGDQAISWRGVKLDPRAFSASLDGKPLDLTRIEFELLHLLLRNRGRTFSRTYLLETVWNENYVGGDRSVDNAVLRLRKKLGPLGDALETVWGVGYRLRAEE